jgi:transposase
MMRGEILDGPERRRRWSEDEKTAILAELAKPGSKGAEVARRYGVSRGLLYTWRKEASLGKAPRGAPAMAFAPVLLTGPAAPAEPLTVPAPPIQSPPFIEIEMKGARVRLPGNAPASTVMAAIKALRGRS